MPDDNVATIRRLYDALLAGDAIVIQDVGRAQAFIDTPAMLEALGRC